MCDDLEDTCVVEGLPAAWCQVLAQAVCPADRCTACEMAVDECVGAGLDCGTLADRCSEALDGCSCERSCKPARELSIAELFSTCFAFPWALGDDCSRRASGSASPSSRSAATSAT